MTNDYSDGARWRAMRMFEETEARERRRLAGELVKRRLVPSSVSSDHDPLDSAIRYLTTFSKLFQQQMADLKCSYPNAGPKLLSETFALLVISDHDQEAAERSFRIRKAEQKAKQAAPTKAKPAGRIIRKEFQQRTIPVPKPGEGRDEFFDRCREELGETGEGEDSIDEQCELAWARRRAMAGQHKAAKDRGIWFTLSDENPDRMGDVVLQNWDLRAFLKNPVALFGHRSDFLVGRWEGLEVRDRALVGKLILAPKGVSPRLDEIIALTEQNFLKTVSVGFRAIKSRPRKDANGAVVGTTFEEQELIEVSLTPTPANPQALAIARQLGVSRDTMSLVFKEARHGR
jgi:HK97 family phage prohead protease